MQLRVDVPERVGAGINGDWINGRYNLLINGILPSGKLTWQWN